MQNNSYTLLYEDSENAYYCYNKYLNLTNNSCQANIFGILKPIRNCSRLTICKPRYFTIFVFDSIICKTYIWRTLKLMRM